MAQEFIKMYRWAYLLARALNTKMKFGQLCWPIGPVFYRAYVTIIYITVFYPLWGMMVTIPYVLYKHPILSTQMIPSSSVCGQEVWEGSDFYQYCIWQGTEDRWDCAFLQERYSRKLSCIMEISVTMLRFWGAGSMMQDILGDWVRGSQAQGVWEPLF